ncbi:TPA: hypothetical protein DDZ86_01180 [Candidatus Dependentiae bacterium]|nr:hypothetical protein [Candidatus Dependentiae bacterium]
MPNLVSIDGLCGYYKGFELSLSEGRALLPECGSPTVFSLVVTPYLTFKMRGKTVSALVRDTTLPCAWWDLTLIPREYEMEGEDGESIKEYSWIIKPVARADMPEALPEHAVVVLIDPQFIETLTEIPSADSINLPTLIFKSLDDAKTKEAFDEAILFATMSRPDMRAINCRERPSCLSALSTAAALPCAHHIHCPD